MKRFLLVALLLVVVIGAVILTFRLINRKTRTVYPLSSVWAAAAYDRLEIVRDSMRSSPDDVNVIELRSKLADAGIPSFSIVHSKDDFGIPTAGGLVVDGDICIFSQEHAIRAVTRRGPNRGRMVITDDLNIIYAVPGDQYYKRLFDGR